MGGEGKRRYMDAVIIFCAKYLFILVVIGVVVAWLRYPNEGKWRFLVSAIIAGVVAVVLAHIAGKLYYDPRPFITEHVKPLIRHAPDNGFPSDHALFTMTLTAITFFYNRRLAAGMLLLTVIVGVARVLARVHSPIDIAGGWLFGIIGAVIGFYVVEWLAVRQVKPGRST